MFAHLRCDPTEHNFILTEPPMNTPENRELIAEIMFETFGVNGLYIGVQAILALFSNYGLRDNFRPTDTLNGCVLDIGDGVAHVIPVCDNYCVTSNIKSMPIAGSNITEFLLKTLRDRGEDLPINNRLEIIREIKENYC